MAQRDKLPDTSMNLDPLHQHKRQGVMLGACNLSTGKAHTWDPLASLPKQIGKVKL